jgi:hypothetical protein
MVTTVDCVTCKVEGYILNSTAHGNVPPGRGSRPSVRASTCKECSSHVKVKVKLSLCFFN